MNNYAAGASNTLIQDLLEALQDDEMADVCLVGKDGADVFANRFVLAARSKVLKSMLYGNFRESTMHRIPLDYDGVILEAIVEFCTRNEIPKFRLYIHRNSRSARRLVQLFKAADYLGLEKLAEVVAQMAHNLTSRYPPLACAVYDEADLHTTVAKDALLMIQCRPYVTLPPDNETEGGIDCLCPTKLLSIYDDKSVKASEMFLFEMLQKWLELRDLPDGTDVAKRCVKYLRLADIEPQDLLRVVRGTGLCPEQRITDAVTTQALRAATAGIWTISSRGRPNVERIIVEGAGSANVNGIYYYIDGLANGDLYSKREVACGQQYVYTLSIAAYNDGITECRIFCSPLLTHKSIRSMARTGAVHGPSFQPLLQVIDVDALSLNSNSKYTKVRPPTSELASYAMFANTNFETLGHAAASVIRRRSLHERKNTHNSDVREQHQAEYLNQGFEIWETRRRGRHNNSLKDDHRHWPRSWV